MVTKFSTFHARSGESDFIPEPLNDNGTFREDVFYNTLGESYIPIALEAARAADPHAKLFINEYNIEGTGQLQCPLILGQKSDGPDFHTLSRREVDRDDQPRALAAGAGRADRRHRRGGPPDRGRGPNHARRELPAVRGARRHLLHQRARHPHAAPCDRRGVRPAEDRLRDRRVCVYAVSACVGITLWDFTDKASRVSMTERWRRSLMLFAVLVGSGHLPGLRRRVPVGRGMQHTLETICRC